MGFINVEIKAKCSDPKKIEDILLQNGARFIGTDHQTDTYFKVNSGRLKLREGNIENALICYDRTNKNGPKVSQVELVKVDNQSPLKSVLEKSLGVLVVVDKQRKIFFIGNIKFHIDDVKGLGIFIEIEAIDKEGNIGRKNLENQCKNYMKLFGLETAMLVPVSYSDLLLKKSDHDD